MTLDDRKGPGARHASADDAYRLFRVWTRFGSEMATRALRLSQDSAGRMAEDISQDVFGTWDPEGTARRVSQECAQLAVELIGVPSGAFGTAMAEYDSAPNLRNRALDRALAGTDPAPTVTTVDVEPGLAEGQRRMLAERAGDDPGADELALPAVEAGAPFLLPARVLDSSQAWASWLIPLQSAHALLEEAIASGHQPPGVADAFAPVAVGRDSAMVSVLVTDYRASDFGVLKELGLTLAVAPRDQHFPDPGQLFLRLIVTHPYSIGAARQVWGIRKDFHDNATVPPRSRFDVSYGEDRVRFGMGALQPLNVDRDHTLQIGFPRLGQSRSDRMPGLIYSMVEPHGLPAAPTGPARSVLTRSGAGEGVQFGGNVTLTLPPDREAGLRAGCFCAGKMACLCDTLRKLSLDRQPPSANGWTERMTGELAQPTPVVQAQTLGKTRS